MTRPGQGTFIEHFLNALPLYEEMVLRDQLSVDFSTKDEIWVAVLRLDYAYREEKFRSSDTQVVTIPNIS